jgi:nucleotidyltransferase/DNA polymerase involved in DNA repair
VAATQVRREAERVQRQMQKEVSDLINHDVAHSVETLMNLCMQISSQVVIRLQEEELRACTFKPHTKKLPAYISRMAASHRSRKHMNMPQPNRTSF